MLPSIRAKIRCLFYNAKVTKKRKRRECSADGCTNNAQSGGVCSRHGAKVKRCCSEGCIKPARRAGGMGRRTNYAAVKDV
eukprot:scaffold2043_cov149-Skeletonema_menzelii.AAC.3